MRGKYAIKLLNNTLTILLAIKRYQSVLGSAFLLLSVFCKLLVEFKTNKKEIISDILLLNKLNIELNIKGATKKKRLTF